ncbi:hypothetical protein E3J79_00290, partial [Candidatus Dependentiae bacterium]
MKCTKSLIITIAILACFNQALLGMTPPGLPGDFAQFPLEMQQKIVYQLSDGNLASLAQTSKQASQFLEDELAQRQLQAAIELSLWLSRRKIDFRRQISNYPDFAQFKEAVLNRLRETAQEHPEQWICLDLSRNNLGSIPSEDLRSFLQSIAAYNIVELHLSGNQLTTLPENIFNKLHKLQRLWLYYNRQL